MVLLERTGLLLWLEEPLPWLQVLSLCLALNHLQYPLMGVIIHTLGLYSSKNFLYIPLLGLVITTIIQLLLEDTTT